MRSAFVLVFVAACLVTFGSFVISAQVIDGSPCEHACFEQKSICVSECGTHDNPVECEAGCHDELIDCQRSCS